MKRGYTDATIRKNFTELRKAGFDRGVAMYRAMCAARVSWFEKPSRGELPVRLALNKKYSRLDYDAAGEPVYNPTYADYKGRGGETVYDPGRYAVGHSGGATAPPRRELQQAAALYQAFTDHAPGAVRKLDMPDMPNAALAVGRIFGIMYSVDATGERFHHEFKPHAQPLLLVAPDGRNVYLHGGAFTFTSRGFVDAPKKRDKRE